MAVLAQLRGHLGTPLATTDDDNCPVQIWWCFHEVKKIAVRLSDGSVQAQAKEKASFCEQKEAKKLS
jgi:hypothetical protein